MDNPLTNTYGSLKGWQWVGLIAAAGAAVVLIRRRAAGSSSSATTGTAVPDASGATGGFNPLQTIVLQNGPASTATGPSTSTLQPIGVKLPTTVPTTSAFGGGFVKVPTGAKVAGGIPTYLLSAKTHTFYAAPATTKGHGTLYVPAAYAPYIGAA